MRQRRFGDGYPMELAHKDLTTLAAEAEELGAELPVRTKSSRESGQ